MQIVENFEQSCTRNTTARGHDNFLSKIFFLNFLSKTFTNLGKYTSKMCTVSMNFNKTLSNKSSIKVKSGL